MVRLGYACINTVLTKQKITTNRTCRLATVKEKGVEHAKELGRLNIVDLCKIIQWNEDHGIRFMRISSDIFPMASEPTYKYSLKYVEKELREAGDLARKYGHRLTTHPGQFNVLCSPHTNVVDKTFVDLGYHAEMLDLMGMDADSVMIIHMGGAYGDKAACYTRFEEAFKRLPKNVADRLVLENDEVSYKVEELLPICKKLKIPLVLDWHHDKLNPSSKPILEYIDEIAAIWKERGIRQKQHYSESANGHPNPRTHSDYIKRLPPCAGDVDLMIEAKMKEQTVLRICRKYDIAPDTKTYPTGEPKPLPDDAEVEDVPSVMLQHHKKGPLGRKKHDWSGKGETDPSKKKRAKKSKGDEDDDEEAEEKPKKRKRVKKEEGDDEVVVKKRKKSVKKEEGDEEVVVAKRKKSVKKEEGDEEVVVEKRKKTVKKHGKAIEEDTEVKVSRKRKGEVVSEKKVSRKKVKKEADAEEEPEAELEKTPKKAAKKSPSKSPARSGAKSPRRKRAAADSDDDSDFGEKVTKKVRVSKPSGEAVEVTSTSEIHHGEHEDTIITKQKKSTIGPDGEAVNEAVVLIEVDKKEKDLPSLERSPSFSSRRKTKAVTAAP